MLKAILDLEQQDPNKVSPEEWQCWKARLEWGCCKNHHYKVQRNQRTALAKPNFMNAAREWKKQDQAWWAQHSLRVCPKNSRKTCTHERLHYNACVALAGDVERVFGVRVPDIAGAGLPAPPATEMPPSLFAFRKLWARWPRTAACPQACMPLMARLSDNWLSSSYWKWNM